MPRSHRTVVLTDEQISFIKTSIDYSLKRIRDTPIDAADDRETALARRREQEGVAASIKRALGDGT